MSASPNGSSPLRSVLERARAQAAAADVQLNMKDLTVLAEQNDPYRRDTPAGHRDGAWFAAMVERFLGRERTIHLRGLHYRISFPGDILKPNGLPYVNTDDDWEWLGNHPAKAARWLGYVPFSRIVDERNAPAEICVPEKSEPSVTLVQGAYVEVPQELSHVLPSLLPVGGFDAHQPYRIILFGEKTSLREILLPIAETYGCELLLPTGEASDTMIAELASRVNEDGRKAVVLYFSDFDPSGWQMAVSVARKLQALRDLLYHGLRIQLYPVALTLSQVRELQLPSTPLKETEKRADNWREKMGHEQTEIDALIALNPDALRSIALKAIAPFYDSTLADRALEAHDEWLREAGGILESHPEFATHHAAINDAYEVLKIAADTLSSAQEDAHEALQEVKEQAPEIVEPEPELDDADQPLPLFTTDDDFASATRRLIAHKALET